ncbi:MAG: adenosylcobalamin-dependent ribonucleoside-diphosphate reductase, partial [Hyphomicrobiaceae bacterium]
MSPPDNSHPPVDGPPDWPRISREIWDAKYRLKTADGTPVDASLAETWSRVAAGAAAAEKPAERARWNKKFIGIMQDFAFLPAGRILAGIGTDRRVTLFNCFVMGEIEDDLSNIFENVREAALTMQSGGGIGHDFSTLRPKGAEVKGVGAQASGPLSFMDVWDTMCRTIMSAGSRRGAMMGTMRCDHPDIEAFIEAKSDPARLRMFNLSVLVTDAFVEAVRADRPWDLVFGGKVYRTVQARDLWRKIMHATYAYAEPGVIFIDRINAASNLNYCETIQCSNPCGEQPLPPHGACLLGSVNLAALVKDPFSDDAALDTGRLRKVVRTAVRFLDNIIDVSQYPLPPQKEEALAKRRIGLGITGLANALAMTGLRYGSKGAARRASKWMSAIQREAYLASAALAEEKGAFPLYDRDRFLAAPGVAALDAGVRKKIAKHGIRNGMVTSIAPTGTISLLAGNVSSGIEPVFDLSYSRKITQPDGSSRTETVEDYAWRMFRRHAGKNIEPPDTFVTAQDLGPEEHLRMQAALQPYVDSAISKTINCPENIPFEDFENIYLSAWEQGLKGCTTYRPNDITGSVLSTA